MSQNPVFIRHGYQIRRDADHEKVEQRDQGLERYAVFLRICLNQLEAYSTAGKVIERIMAIIPLRIKYCHGLRKFVLRKMVVTDDHVYALASCIFDLFIGLDAAVKGYDKPEAVFRGPVYALVRHTVTFIISFRDIEVDLTGKFAQERIYERHGCRSVHIVVTIDEYLLMVLHCLADPFHSLVHIGHQERVMKVVQIRTEK